MRRLILVLVVLLLEALLVGCGNDDPQTATPAEPASSATAAPAETGKTIPDGTYARSVTVAGARAVGIADEDFLAENFGEGGKATFTYRFAGDRWTLFVTHGGAPEPGDGGTLKYDRQGDAVLESGSEGCGGCVYTYDWQLDGKRLTMTLVGHESSDGPEELVLARFVTEGVYMRQS